MSGLLTVAEYRAIVPATTLSDPAIRNFLMAAQGITERLTGYRFGCEVTGVINTTGNIYRLDVGYPLGEPGSRVRLIGGGVSSDPFVILDASRDWITVESNTTINPTKALPIVEFVGHPSSGYVYVFPLPLFSVVSVKKRNDPDQLWGATDITEIPAASYETFTKASGIKCGVYLRKSDTPRQRVSTRGLIKSMSEVPRDSVRVEYVAGFYASVPMDLQMAQVELVSTIERSSTGGGTFASESFDYYSYQTLTYEQTASVPSSALATFRRYSR